MYPTIAQSDIKRILQYGWKAFYLHNSYGGDVLVNQGKLWFYSGYLMKDSLRWFEYYQHKMKTKLRVMYKRKKIKWDGYYIKDDGTIELTSKIEDVNLNSGNKTFMTITENNVWYRLLGSS